MEIEELCLIESIDHCDGRGYFMETFHENNMKEAGLDFHFVQDNHSWSIKGILRGLHYQKYYHQTKLPCYTPDTTINKSNKVLVNVAQYINTNSCITLCKDVRLLQ